MDNQRLLIWAVFGVLAWMTYQAWVEAYAPAPTAVPTEVSQPAAQTDPGLPALGEIESAADVPGELPSLEPQPEVASAAVAAAASIQVRTDTLDVHISTAGGTLTSAKLLKYPVAKDKPEEKINLLSDSPDNLALLQSGFLSRGGVADANHQVIFNAGNTSFDLGNSDQLSVPL
jgi:YidC/Oxa1 family membrane protein insertase